MAHIDPQFLDKKLKDAEELMGIQWPSLQEARIEKGREKRRLKYRFLEKKRSAFMKQSDFHFPWKSIRSNDEVQRLQSTGRDGAI